MVFYFIEFSKTWWNGTPNSIFMSLTFLWIKENAWFVY